MLKRRRQSAPDDIADAASDVLRLPLLLEVDDLVNLHLLSGLR
jgi:hypothetical protein